ncbi:MAG: sporulation protein YabP [Bacilli bacterium]|nr:sporulation protein YabP [Bacilli bacterium]
MEKQENDFSTYNHGINITERKSLIVSGVKKIENFDENEFLMETTMGMLAIKGEELELIKLDTMQGSVSIKGKINSIEYIENTKDKEKDGIISRLFK